MITGCNSLVSQNFGTHALRAIPASEATVAGIGDADFVEINGVDFAPPQLTRPADNPKNGRYVLRPLLTAAQIELWNGGATVATSLVGWFKSTDPACAGREPCLPYTGTQIIGLVNEPAVNKNPVGEWPAQRINLVEPVVYLEVGQAPLAWHWNLLMFLGGAVLAFLPEALRFRKRETGIKDN